jgi:L-fuconolactonase
MTAQVVDSHVHMIDPQRLNYPWLQAAEPLNRRWDAAAYAAAAPEIAGAIVVEAGAATAQASQEIAFVRAQAAAQPWISGVVAFAPVDDPMALKRVLPCMAEDMFVAGVRWNLQDEPPGFLSEPGLVAGIRRLGEAGLPFDACVRVWQLTELDELAAACPDTVIVLDHAGKPRCGGDLAGWRASIQALAARPNLRCKLSGLATEAALGAQPADILAVILVALTEFGADRCMYGSDWPVCMLATSPRSWLDLITEGLDGIGASANERKNILAGTAIATYRLLGAAMTQEQRKCASRASS